MDPLTIGAIASIGGGLLGNILGQGDERASQEAIKDIGRLYSSIALPDTEKMKLDLQKYQSAGDLDLKQYEDLQQAVESELQNIQLDPRLRQTQLDRLSMLEKITQQGFTPEDLARIEGLRRQSEADLTSRLAGLDQQQAARGISTSDSALAQKLLESQSAANRQSQAALELGAQAFQNKMQASQQAADLAANIEGTDYNRESNVARALDAIINKNFDSKRQTSMSNVDKFNEALKYNLGNKQRISDANVGLSNEQQQYNKQLEQQKFENQMKKASGQAGAKQQEAGMYAGSAQNTRNMIGGITQGVGGIIAGMGSGGSSVGTQVMPSETSGYSGRGSYASNKF